MILAPKTVRIFGILQVFLAVCMYFIGIIKLFLVPYEYSILSGGIWCGTFVLCTGLLALRAATQRAVDNPRRCMIGFMIGLGVSSAILSGIIIVFYLMALYELSKRLRCPEDEYPTPSSYLSASFCSGYNRNKRWHVTFNQAELGVILSCLLITAAGLEFFLALATSMYGCNVYYSRFYERRRRQQRVTYERQPLGGYVNFTVPYSDDPLRSSAQQMYDPTEISTQTVGSQSQTAPPRYSTQTNGAQEQSEAPRYSMEDDPTIFGTQTVYSQPQDVPTGCSTQAVDSQPQDVPNECSTQAVDRQLQDVPTGCSTQAVDSLLQDVPTECSTQAVDSQLQGVPTECSTQAVDTLLQDVPTECSTQAVDSQPQDVPIECSTQAVDSQPQDVPTECSSQAVDTELIAKL